MYHDEISSLESKLQEAEAKIAEREKESANLSMEVYKLKDVIDGLNSENFALQKSLDEAQGKIKQVSAWIDSNADHQIDCASIRNAVGDDCDCGYEDIFKILDGNARNRKGGKP